MHPAIWLTRRTPGSVLCVHNGSSSPDLSNNNKAHPCCTPKNQPRKRSDPSDLWAAEREHSHAKLGNGFCSSSATLDASSAFVSGQGTIAAPSQ